MSFFVNSAMIMTDFAEALSKSVITFANIFRLSHGDLQRLGYFLFHYSSLLFCVRKVLVKHKFSSCCTTMLHVYGYLGARVAHVMTDGKEINKMQDGC